MRHAHCAGVLLIAACQAARAPAPSPATTRVIEGDYALGPVAFHDAEWNACGPYLAPTEQQYGVDLLGVSMLHGGHGELCDACVEVQTRVGTRVIARVVTYGETRAPGDVDLSPHAFESILRPDPHAPAERPRPMSWRIVPCDTAAPIAVQFQTKANVDWTSLWIRNPRWPVSKVEVRSSRHGAFFALRRETDGSFNDDHGFGPGPFALRVHASTGAMLEVHFDTIVPGALLATERNFD